MRYVYITILLLLFVNCSGQKNNDANAMEEKQPLNFVLPSPPSVLTEPAERAAYLVKHYWDNFNFSDRRYVDVPEVTEQAFVDYIDILPHSTYQTATESIQNTLDKAATDSLMFFYFTGLFEKYLHDPNSPFRNEEFYIPVLETIVSSPLVDDIDKIRPLHLLELAYRNRIGEQATDFTYTLTNGSQKNMHAVTAEYLVLYFYNPDCHSCKEITAELNSSSIITNALKDGKLKILAVYPDEDLTAWKNHISQMPASWINSYDKGTTIKDEDIYDLKAIPTLYLLGKNKEVILKDTSFEELEHYLQHN